MDTSTLTTHLEIAAYHAARVDYHRAQLAKALAAVTSGASGVSLHGETDPDAMRGILADAWANDSRVICTFALHGKQENADSDLLYLLNGEHVFMQEDSPDDYEAASFVTHSDSTFNIGPFANPDDADGVVYLSSVRPA